MKQQTEPRTRDECIAAAGRAFAQAIMEQAALTPREAAEAAHERGGPSVDELERRIRSRRGEDPVPTAPPSSARAPQALPAAATERPGAQLRTPCPGPHHRLVYSAAQAAEQLSISPTVLREIIAAGDLPTIQYADGGRRRGITHEALLEWIASREAAAG